MGSLRFPFPSFPPPRNTNTPFPRRSIAAAAAVACTAAAAAGIAIAHNSTQKPLVEKAPLSSIISHFPWLNPNRCSSFSPLWASFSLSSDDLRPAVEPKTNVAFPQFVKGSQRLEAYGALKWKKAFFGFSKHFDAAFGMSSFF